MTAATEINDAKIADLNVDQWINKPFDLEELRERSYYYLKNMAINFCRNLLLNGEI